MPTTTSATTINPTGCIAVSPHLAQFVVWIENLPDGTTPLRVPGLGPITAALASHLVSYSDYRRSPMRTSVDALGARLYYVVDGRERTGKTPPPGMLSLFSDDEDTTEEKMYVPRKERFVNDKSIIDFNRFLDQFLRYELNRAIIEAKKRGIHECEAIEGFMTEVGIHDLIDFDTLKKSAWRRRVWLGTDIIRGNQFRPRQNTFSTPTPARPHW
jgi:hypothetical protein